MSSRKTASHLIVSGWRMVFLPSRFLRLATDLGYTHVVQKNGLEYQKELTTTEVLIENPAGFFDFPMAAIFNPSDLSPNGNKQSIIADTFFNGSNDKRAVLELFMAAMAAKNLSQTLIQDLTLVSDEMFTNAVFNAPFTDSKTNKNRNVSRQDVEVVFEPIIQDECFSRLMRHELWWLAKIRTEVSTSPDTCRKLRQPTIRVPRQR